MRIGVLNLQKKKPEIEPLPPAVPTVPVTPEINPSPEKTDPIPEIPEKEPIKQPEIIPSPEK